MLQGRGYRKSFLSTGFEMKSNESYHTFPIDSGNQTNRNVPSVEINVRFCPEQHVKILFVGCQVQQNVEEEVELYNEVDDILYILYLDCAVFSLNSADAFSSIINLI